MNYRIIHLKNKNNFFVSIFRNSFPLSIQFSQLSVYFNLKEYDGLANITDSEQLKLSSGEQRILSFNFVPKGDHIQRTLEVKKNEFLCF